MSENASENASESASENARIDSPKIAKSIQYISDVMHTFGYSTEISHDDRYPYQILVKVMNRSRHRSHVNVVIHFTKTWRISNYYIVKNSFSKTKNNDVLVLFERNNFLDFIKFTDYLREDLSVCERDGLV